jgi:hypothetical protein
MKKYVYLLLIVKVLIAKIPSKIIQEEKPKFYWKQTHEDVEIWFYVLPGKLIQFLTLNQGNKGY